VPDGFAVGGRPGTPLEWRDVVNAIVDELAEFLWPRFDSATGSWQGNAQQTAMALTTADLALMTGALASKLTEAVGGDGAKLKVTHKFMFEEEDESKPGTPYPMLDHYLPSVPAEGLTQLKDAIKKSVVGFGPGPLRFKELLQRPRPHQVAFMLKKPLSFEWARSSMTPSMVSGHSLTGLLGRCSGYMSGRLRLQLEDVAGAIGELQRYSVDFGDRRVFAGVHYPSDNLASWFVALRLCDHFYGEVGHVAKAFMVKAIRDKSTVFAAIAAAVASAASSPYALPMKRLNDEMNRPARRSEP
jgi:hypothetical protein